MMLVLYGPTVTGKTALAIQFAKSLNGELISADSRQVYKYLDIGTGKVSFESKTEKHTGYWIVDGIKINGFDLVDPETPFSVADFLKFASNTISQIESNKKLPIIVGGTGFYIKALIEGIESIGIPRDLKLRQQLEELPIQELYRKLESLNPQRARSMNESDRQNPRRLIRAIEISLSTEDASTYYKLHTTNYLLIGLTAPNEYLYQKADHWLEVRMQHGLIEEVQQLLDQKIDSEWLENLGLEYRWITRYLKEGVSKDEAIKRLKGDIHNFIRRQKTWFMQFPQIEVFDISTKNYKNDVENKIETWYSSLEK